MFYGVYVMRDKKTDFLFPSYDVNDASAIRNFECAIMRSPDILKTHSEDFELYKIGSYDSKTADIKLLDVKELLCEGKDVKNE